MFKNGKELGVAVKTGIPRGLCWAVGMKHQGDTVRVSALTQENEGRSVLTLVAEERPCELVDTISEGAMPQMLIYYAGGVEPKLHAAYRVTLATFRARQAKERGRVVHIVAQQRRAARVRTEQLEQERSAEFSIALQFYCVAAVQDSIEPLLWLDYSRRTADANEQMHEGETLAQFMWSRGLSAEEIESLTRHLGLKTPEDARTITEA